MHYFIKILLFTAIIVLRSISLSAQDSGSISGIILSNNKPIPSATVGIESLNKGTFSDDDGQFLLQNIPEGEYTISVSAVGLQPFKQNIFVEANEQLFLELKLRISITELEQVIVTGTLKETTIKDSPVKVSWISGQALEKSASENLMDAVKYINGLYNQVDCAVCGTNNIRINGMAGPYTAVLIDGMPIMGALASVYGLNGINPNIIQNLEIIKGPNSTLYGSQAMGGVVNIITKDPGSSPMFSIQANTSTHLEHNLNLAYAPNFDKSHVLFSSSLFHSNTFIDENNDGFSDLTQDTRFTFFNKWSFERPDFKKASFGAKLYLEERMGGVEAFDHSVRGSDEIYGESIYTNRIELFGSYDLPFSPENFWIDASYAYHHQDSYYGDYNYKASQQTFFSNLIWDKSFSKKSDLLAGAAIHYDILDQLFNHNVVDGGSADKRFVPGVFLQYDHRWNDTFRTLAGIRADHHLDHGVIFSPRFNAKIKPGSHTTFRLNVGTGFRIVNLFTEEHEALTGSREVIVAESLNPERSVNLALNLNQIIDIGPYSILNTDFDIFYTRFSNQIIPDYDTSNQIIYTNLDGHSVSRGISLSMAHNFIAPLTYMVGVTVQDVFSVENGVKEDLLFAPNYTAVFNATYTLQEWKLTLDYTGRINGKIKLPDYPNRNQFSEAFTEQNIKFSKRFNSGIQIFVSGKNLFNYTQPSPIIAPDRPFSDEFATDYVFGPIQGRRFLAGISFDLE
ncbi:MAG: TonB-dependent receptor [Gracilimonas sp.]|uniref:TonB-dependent receptor n=1 Tax=Gracilimonas sp. TaxID=1974203 RepID=UPI001995738C|nr:TonB-dependent receptor [Gracilimonas sp.]MBD3616619.1 TonB-dependent receptor [Gracilimonas sp.]